MNIPFVRALNRLLERRSTNYSDMGRWERIFTSTYDTSAGVSVNPNTALQSTAVFACIRVLSFSLAQLPLVTYRRLERGKERATEHPVYKLLHDQPNPELTSFHWRATAMAHICLYGNSYAEIEVDGAGLPVALWLIPAWRCEPVRVNTAREQNKLVYEVNLPDGSQRRLPPEKVLHFRSLSTDGLKGLSIIRQAAQAIGVSLAAQDFAARFFGQGMNVGGVLEHPGHLSTEAYNNLKNDLAEKYAGLGKSHRIILLEEGMKFNKVGIPPEEAQFLESRQFQVVDIARMFGVPPHKVGDLSRATFSNIEHQAIEFVQDTMMPWFVSWEQELNRKLLGGDYFCEFLVEGLLRGDSASRAEFYKAMFNMAALSPNDIREKENMNPVEHGDRYFVPLNMMPITSQNTEDRKQERRSLATNRLKVARSYHLIFEETAKRIVERETRDIRKEIKKQRESRSVVGFRDYIKDFYRDFQIYIANQIKPPVVSLAKAIASLAAEEVHASDCELAAFPDEYARTFAYRYAKSSEGQLLALLDEGADWDEIEKRLIEWEEKRPNKVALNEIIQLSNAVAKLIFASVGIQMLVWRNVSQRPCPYCQQMDGKKVAIDQDFLGHGAHLEGEDGGTMEIYRPTSHPPLHLGCECQLEPA